MIIRGDKWTQNYGYKAKKVKIVFLILMIDMCKRNWIDPRICQRSLLHQLKEKESEQGLQRERDFGVVPEIMDLKPDFLVT